MTFICIKSLCEHGKSFQEQMTRCQFGTLGFFDWTGFDMAGQSRRVHARVPRELIVLIGTLSSNQKDVSPFPILF